MLNHLSRKKYSLLSSKYAVIAGTLSTNSILLKTSDLLRLKHTTRFTQTDLRYSTNESVILNFN